MYLFVPAVPEKELSNFDVLIKKLKIKIDHWTISRVKDAYDIVLKYELEQKQDILNVIEWRKYIAG